MTLFLVWIFVTYGITKIIVEGDIFYKVRDLFNKKSTSFIYSILTCALCCSTWVGFIISYIIQSFGEVTPSSILDLPMLVTIFMDGMFTAGTVWLIYSFENYLNE